MNKNNNLIQRRDPISRSSGNQHYFLYLEIFVFLRVTFTFCLCIYSCKTITVHCTCTLGIDHQWLSENQVWGTERHSISETQECLDPDRRGFFGVYNNHQNSSNCILLSGSSLLYVCQPSKLKKNTRKQVPLLSKSRMQ